MDIETALTNKFLSSAEFGTTLEDAYNLTTATCTDVTACLEEAESQGIDIMADLREVLVIMTAISVCHPLGFGHSDPGNRILTILLAVCFLRLCTGHALHSTLLHPGCYSNRGSMLRSPTGY